MSSSVIKPQMIDREETSDPGRQTGWKTILFNCDCHSFQDVAFQLMKAIRCSYERGLQLANVVHHTGSAIVFSGAKTRCEGVSRILEDIGLRTAVEQ